MRSRILTVLVVAGAAAAIGAGQLPGRRAGGLSPAIESLAGVDTFNYYCVGCHGQTGRGGGIVASSLKTPVPDLTTLSARNGGAFPRERVRAAVANTERPVTAHGSGDMPVWQTMFGVLDGTPERTAVRIDFVVRYLETLQREYAPERVGRALFLTHCATCHGPEARGGGPMAAQLRHEVPDLTLFTVRNGGVFPSMRVSRIIDGREVASHGNREMPVWGDVFMKTGPGGEQEAAQRIDALTKYLEVIQQMNGE